MDANQVLHLELALADDPDLDGFEASIAARAEFLVTGNGEHFPPDRRCGVRVVSPRELIDAERSRIGT